MVVSQTTSAEIMFPRGGQKKIFDQKVTSQKAVKEKDLFSASNASSKSIQAQKKHKKKQVAKEKAKTSNKERPSVEIVEALSYGQITEGMLIMGRISAIRELDMRISLPGRLMATCPITNISSSYTNALKEVTSGSNMDTDSDDYPRLVLYMIIRYSQKCRRSQMA